MLPFDIDTILTAALAFLRIGGILFALPFFGDTTVPLQVRIMIVIAVSIGLYPVVTQNWGTTFNGEAIPTAMIVIRELFIGLTIGYIAKLMFEGIILAANMVGYQMGFGTASVFVADASAPLSAFTVFHRLIALLIFLSLNLHHTFVMAIIDSFKFIPAGAASMHSNLATMVIDLTQSIFSVAAQMSAPIIVALMFTMAALGLIARTVPQMNVFTMSFPLSFFIGMIIYISSTPFMYEWLQKHFYLSAQTLFEAINSMRPL